MTRNHSPAFWLMASELTVKFQYVMKYYTKLQALTGSLGCPAQQKLQHCYLECLEFVGYIHEKLLQED
jgi:hypothetical protein